MNYGNDSEFAVLRDWVNATFGMASENAGHPAQLRVIKQKWGPCAVNQSLCRTPLTIGRKKFACGLAVHAVSEVVVSLPSPGSVFRASIGRDQNSAIGENAAAITFAVTVGEEELYRSPTLHGGEDALEITVPLANAREFTLRVEGSEDWANGDWADARIALADGRTLWLDELPFDGALPVKRHTPPFSLVYNGRPSAEFIGGWQRQLQTEVLDDERTRQTLVFSDPAARLEIRCEALVYRDYPAVEWVVRLTNNSQESTGIIQELQAMDIELNRGDHDREFVLHHAIGSLCAERDFAPQLQVLSPGQEFRLAPVGGRSSSGTLPFFNVESGGSGGVIGAVGWTGQWQALFRRDGKNRLAMQAGMEGVRLKLQPGESIRTPSILLLFWRGSDRVRSHNLLRSLILKHYTPRPSGQPLQPPVAFSTWGMLSEEALVKKLDIIKNAGWPVDCFWVDAGWFGDCQRTDDWYAQAGNWHPNPRLFPNGLAPVAETAHRQGCKFLLWFDMERVYQNSELHREHPEWLIDLPPEQQIDPFTGKLGYRGNCMLNLGHPAARAWATDFLSAMISSTGIDILREDFNIDPLPFWRHADAPDRQGMTEIQYITGLYELLDELLKRHPHLTIDNCASGGRRLDLEMTRRSIPLWRSDLQCSIDYSALGSQAQTFGLASWLPLNCAGTRNWLDTYDFRSALSAGCAVCWPTLEHPDQEMAWAGKMLAEASLLRPLFQGDFYPLTQYSLSNDVWLAYQLNREDRGDGAVLAYRREQAPYPCAVLKLQSLERKTIYELRDLDSGETREASGGELMTAGLELKLNHAPDCAIVLYRKK